MRSAFTLLLLFSCVELSACSGGGSGSFGGQPILTPTAVSAATVRALVEANLAQFPIAIARAGIDPMIYYVPAYMPEPGQSGACDGGTTTTVSGSGTFNFTYAEYRDSACTLPWQKFTGKYVVGSSGNTVTATGTVYASNGAGMLTESVAATTASSPTQTQTSVTVTVPNGQTLSYVCLDAAVDEPSSETCSYGSVLPLPSGAPSSGIGTLTTINDMEIPGGIGGDGTLQVYFAPPSGLTLTNTPAPLSVVGANQAASYAQAIDFQVEPNEILSTIMIRTDTTTLAADGGFAGTAATGTGTVLQSYGTTTDPNTRTVGSYQFDIFGNGSLTYQDGTQTPITNFGV